MLLPIMQVGESVLRHRAEPLTMEEIRSPRLGELIEHMKETMREAPGVGLAAPQIGLSLQLAVIEDREDMLKDVSPEKLAETERSPVPFHVIINPKLTLGDERVDFFEGCLSVPKFGALVSRARRVTVDCLNERGEPVRIEASGWFARILQHEIDHLNGCLYLDRMSTRTFMTVDNFAKYWKSRSIADLREALEDEHC